MISIINENIFNTNLPNELIPINILSKYKVRDIQVEVVRIFLEQHNIEESHIKNQLIKDFLNVKNKNIYEEIIKLNINWGIEEIESVFYLQFTKDTVNDNGIVYTPYYISDYINEQTMLNLEENSSLIDLSCGSGAFLLSAVRLFKKKFPNVSVIDIVEKNIYGVDILDENIYATKLLLILYVLISGEDQAHIEFNLLSKDVFEADILCEFSESNTQGGFNYIVGNPPYVKIQNMNKKLKQTLKDNFLSCQSGNYNLFYAFIELSFKMIKPSGRIGYIVPNHLLKMKSAQNLRKVLIDNKYIEKIIDFKDYPIFDSIQTYSSIMLLNLDEKEGIYYNQVQSNEISNVPQYLKNISFNYLKYEDVNSEIINLLSDKERQNIENIESQPYSLKISTGIATQKDNLYIIKNKGKENNMENEKYYFKEFNQTLFPIEKDITIPIIKGSGTKKIKSGIDFHCLNRIIYPYEEINGEIRVINEAVMAKKYPKTLDYFHNIKKELNKRNGGNPTTKVWYEYGRSQALGSYIPKIIFPTNSDVPNFVYFSMRALFHNGYAIYGVKESDANLPLPILEKILNSSVMNYYIRLTSYMISGGYYCYQKKYIENFRIPKFTGAELKYLEQTDNQREIDEFLFKKYQLHM